MNLENVDDDIGEPCRAIVYGEDGIRKKGFEVESAEDLFPNSNDVTVAISTKTQEHGIGYFHNTREIELIYEDHSFTIFSIRTVLNHDEEGFTFICGEI